MKEQGKGPEEIYFMLYGTVIQVEGVAQIFTKLDLIVGVYVISPPHPQQLLRRLPQVHLIRQRALQ